MDDKHGGLVHGVRMELDIAEPCRRSVQSTVGEVQLRGVYQCADETASTLSRDDPRAARPLLACGLCRRCSTLPAGRLVSLLLLMRGPVSTADARTRTGAPP
jgi:hypothetical protein